MLDGTPILEQLPESRSAAVRAIPLEEAIDQLRGLAVAVEITHANHLLRVIHEFECTGPVSVAHPIPPSIRVVDPNVPDADRLHLVDPRTEERKTFCGVSYIGWKLLDTISARAAQAERRDICRRCRRSLELALDACAPPAPEELRTATSEDADLARPAARSPSTRPQS